MTAADDGLAERLRVAAYFFDGAGVASDAVAADLRAATDAVERDAAVRDALGDPADYTAEARKEWSVEDIERTLWAVADAALRRGRADRRTGGQGAPRAGGNTAGPPVGGGGRLAAL